jgi:type IV secretion system protein VirD4
MKAKVHLVVDEAGNLGGRMDSITDVLNVGRGFGLHLQLYFQDIGQLPKNFENPQGVLANTTQIFFAVNDKDTSEYISARLGNETIVVDSGGTNAGWSRNHSMSSGSSHSASSGSSYSGGNSQNWQQQSRELLKSAEVGVLNPRIAITITPGCRPIATRLVRYYEERSLFRRRGLLRRAAVAVSTFVWSVALLAVALILAAALSSGLSDVIEQQRTEEVPPGAFQPHGHPAAPSVWKQSAHTGNHRFDRRNP